uniref:Tetrathionate reductase beta subunit n=1 Tax=Candidatus Kentrum sp. TUN TaxID=2126343 RepID=A0A450ZBU5_9GAMM|nr:MAG: tetrathionate reductase beta subunit [Candidatus Kentron sp. TUN]VFK52602.1 MAG: tetrathionate reductase beta subunit [Candidatus Kentron sp. TUN]VFK53099.1 MAG: tetrathionate reductase beta subunit [Candidatus Kentron sp. TUN]
MNNLPPEVPRRAFLKELLGGSLSVVMVCAPWRLNASASKQGGGTDKPHDYAFVVDVSKCIGCGKCVEACKKENRVPKGMTRTWVERYVTTNQGVYVDSPEAAMNGFQEEVPAEVVKQAKRSTFVPKLCNHCKKAPCIQICPVGATFRTSDGFVLVDPEHCIACGYCVQRCPYSARFINPITHIADKCTWCYHRITKGLRPACVTVCPTGARQFGDLNDPESSVTKVFAEDSYSVLRPDMHTDNMCFYLNLPREVI